MPRTLLSRILAAKALAVLALAAGTTGGVALAAGTTVESGHVRHVDPASADPSGPHAVDDASASTAPTTTRAATTARPRVAGSAEPDGVETGSGNDHCRAVAAGLPSATPAPLPPGADNEASEAAEHACAVAAPGRAPTGSPGNSGDHNGNGGNGGGKVRPTIRTTPPVPLPGLTNEG